MSGSLIALTGLIYLNVALEQQFKFENFHMFCPYIGYAFPNIGLYMMASGT